MKSLPAVIAATFVGGAVSAATFDFTGYSDGITETLTETDSGLTVNITAGAYLGDGNLYYEEDQDATITVFGVDLVDLAVAQRDDCAVPGLFGGCFISQDAGIGVALADINLIGDINMTQLLTFDFGQMVDFGSVVFGNVDDDDDFDLFIDGVFVAPGEFGIAGNNPFDLTGLSGTKISFGADALFDDFNVQSISATVSAVPLPAGAVLMLTGIAGFAATRRRKS
ncbi:VPLPA-CTERM sorting domain-containing protein [Aliishimia ponticola]|nr:VPLPA-CTERM sorting domain-containing protein [Aliishimia ponticola]